MEILLATESSLLVVVVEVSSTLVTEHKEVDLAAEHQELPELVVLPLDGL